MVIETKVYRLPLTGHAIGRRINRFRGDPSNPIDFSAILWHVQNPNSSTLKDFRARVDEFDLDNRTAFISLTAETAFHAQLKGFLPHGEGQGRLTTVQKIQILDITGDDELIEDV